MCCECLHQPFTPSGVRRCGWPGAPVPSHERSESKTDHASMTGLPCCRRLIVRKSRKVDFTVYVYPEHMMSSVVVVTTQNPLQLRNRRI